MLKVTHYQIAKHAELWAKYNLDPYPWNKVRQEVQFVPVQQAEPITFTTASPHAQRGGVFFQIEPSGQARS